MENLGKDIFKNESGGFFVKKVLLMGSKINKIDNGQFLNKMNFDKNNDIFLKLLFNVIVDKNGSFELIFDDDLDIVNFIK